MNLLKRKIKETDNMYPYSNAFCTICNKKTRMKVMTTQTLSIKNETKLLLVSSLDCGHYNAYDIKQLGKSFTKEEVEKLGE